MKFKVPPVEIAAEEPFKNDALGRKESAEILTQFVRATNTPFVLAIDSPWGTGKTTFLTMWSHLLKKEGFHCLFFNAWENDFSDSPLVALIGEVGESLKHMGLTGDRQSNATKAFEKTKKIGTSLLKAALPTAVKLATSGLVDLADLDGKELSSFAEELAKKQIEKYQHDKESIKSFRESLEKFVKTVSEDKKEETTKPVIFIIDELDRCRPDYAIQLLEKIKHLFNVPGLVFVLAMDMQQLGESIKSVYGGGLNADGYLRRFVDLHYRLPVPEAGKFITSLFSRFELEKAFNLRHEQLRFEPTHLEEIMAKLSALLGFSLRTQEQCFTTISVALRTTPLNTYLYPYHLGLLVCLRAANRNLYDQYVKGETTPIMILDYVRGLPGGVAFFESALGMLIEAHLIVGIRDEQKRRKMQQEYYDLANSNAPTSSSNRAKEVARHFQWVGQHSMDMTGYIHKKIEIAHRFV